MTDLGALGGNLLSIEGCRGENIELTLRHRGEDVAVGFVPYITGNITDTDVQADICVNNTEDESDCFGDVSVGIIAGGWSKKGMILNCRDRKSTRLNSSHRSQSRMPSSA